MLNVIDKREVKPTIIFIIGMHRSGTSVMTRLINIMGANISNNLMPAHETNKKGFWEALNIVVINDRILSLCNSSWCGLTPLPVNWNERSDLEKLRIEARDILATEYAHHDYSVIKDPRMCRLLPFWLPLLEQAGFNAKFIYNLRNPLEVIESLKKRDSLSDLYAGLFWLDHNLNAEKLTRNYPRVFVAYDDILNKPYEVLKKIHEKLKLTFTTPSATAESQIDTFLDKELWHHVAKPEYILNFPNPAIAQWLIELYLMFFSMNSNFLINKITGRYSRLNNLYDNFNKTICSQKESKLANQFCKLMKSDKALLKRWLE